jgi:hypothetical protein
MGGYQMKKTAIGDAILDIRNADPELLAYFRKKFNLPSPKKNSACPLSKQYTAQKRTEGSNTRALRVKEEPQAA